MLSGPDDPCNAYLDVHAGAGGTESCDWTEMLLRMYLRWADRHGFKTETIDVIAGEEAGLRRATLHVIGRWAYGYLKAEIGVHRLVRISPFDANKRRHTSFAAVDVTPELPDEAEIEIKEDDLKVDTFRSGGAGGQHVNKTESAIRITHLPSGIIVQCQNDRSQHKNRRTAMKMLMAKLHAMQESKRQADISAAYDAKGEVSFGYQIRSYVLQPYQIVKDLRTEVETGNVEAVLDGDIDQFIEPYLKQLAGKKPGRRFSSPPRHQDTKYDGTKTSENSLRRSWCLGALVVKLRGECPDGDEEHIAARRRRLGDGARVPAGRERPPRDALGILPGDHRRNAPPPREPEIPAGHPHPRKRCG